MQSDKCRRCEKETHLIQVSDHPDYLDGRYCEDCNPYEVDRKLEEEALDKARQQGRSEALGDSITWRKEKLSDLSKPKLIEAIIFLVQNIDKLSDKKKLYYEMLGKLN